MNHGVVEIMVREALHVPNVVSLRLVYVGCMNSESGSEQRMCLSKVLMQHLLQL